MADVNNISTIKLLEYEWAHRFCNREKTNELFLRPFSGEFDVSSVTKVLDKIYNHFKNFIQENKKQFIENRTAAIRGRINKIQEFWNTEIEGSQLLQLAWIVDLTHSPYSKPLGYFNRNTGQIVYFTRRQDPPNDVADAARELVEIKAAGSKRKLKELYEFGQKKKKVLRNLSQKHSFLELKKEFDNIRKRYPQYRSHCAVYIAFLKYIRASDCVAQKCLRKTGSQPQKSKKTISK